DRAGPAPMKRRPRRDPEPFPLVLISVANTPVEAKDYSPSPSGEGLGWGFSSWRGAWGTAPPPSPPLKGRGLKGRLVCKRYDRLSVGGQVRCRQTDLNTGSGWGMAAALA